MITVQEEELPEEIGWLDPRWLDPRPKLTNAAEQAEEFAMNVWHKFQSWKVVGFANLPQWLQDNDFLRKGHRPPLPSFRWANDKQSLKCHVGMPMIITGLSYSVFLVLTHFNQCTYV